MHLSDEIVSYRHIRVPSASTYGVQELLYVRTHDRYIPSEARYGREKVTKEDEDAVELDQKPCEWPSEENEEYAGHECCSALKLLSPCEEQQGLLWSNDEGESNEEENL